MEYVHTDQKLRVNIGNSNKHIDVPVANGTLCSDIITFCCKPPRNPQTHLVEVWRGCERVVDVEENIIDLLKHWGQQQQQQVSFYLRNGPAMPVPQQDPGRRPRKGRNGMREDDQENMVGGGVDLTLTELQEMASRQQRQIDDQQQMLVAKEQRLKFLKQQEVRHQQIASENERLRKLREKVEAQELKLKKLRALRGQVSDQKHTNTSLSSELETIKSLFNEKEKELSLAVNKVEELTDQLEELRRGRMDGSMNGSGENNTALFELNKLKKEVVIRNKLNEQQHSKLAAHRDIMNQRQSEMTTMDKRIAELQQRLRAKKQLQQANRNHSNNVFSSQQNNNNKPNWGGNNVAAVEPYRVNNNEDSNSSTLSKQDPKYQSLPFNVKFPDQNKENRSGGKPGVVRGQISTGMPVNKALQKVAGMNIAPIAPHTSQQQPGPYKGSSDVQSSPSILYATGESPGSPMTSTPVTSQQQAAPSSAANTALQHQTTPVSSKQHPTANTREIFITGAPVSPKSSTSVPLSQQQQQQQGQFRTAGSNDGGSSPVPRAGLSPSQQLLQQHARTGSNDSSGSQQLQKPQHLRSSSNESSSPSPIQQQSHHKQSSDDYSGGEHEVGRSESTSALPRVTPQHQTITRQVNSDSNIHNTHPHSSSKPVRYASRDVIANTYTNKHNSHAMDQYRKNMNQLYKDFKSTAESSNTSNSTGQSSSPNSKSSEEQQQLLKEGSPTATVKPFQQQQKQESPPNKAADSPSVQQQQNSSQSPSIRVEGAESPEESNQPATYGGVYNIDPERSRYGKQVLHAPRPLRRRHSSGGDSSPDAKHKYSPAQQQQPASPHTQTVDPTSKEPPQSPANTSDVVHVDLTLNEDDDTDDDAFKQEPVNIIAASDDIPYADESRESPAPKESLPVALRRRKGNLKSKDYVKSSRRVSFDPLALLLDAALEGELDLVTKSAHGVSDPSCPNDEGITALHNAICAGHYDIVKFLVEYGCDVNSPDSDGWTPLHCAASCNNLGMVRILVEHGACILAETISDHETAADKCEEDEEGYHGCSEYLYSMQEKLGIANKGEVFSVFNYEAVGPDELSFKNGDSLYVLRKGDEQEKEWWWAKQGKNGSSKKNNKPGYIPRNLIGMFPRITPKWLTDEKK